MVADPSGVSAIKDFAFVKIIANSFDRQRLNRGDLTESCELQLRY